MRAYTRQYQYDKIGNVQQVKQLGTNGFTRNFVYNTGVNTLQKIEDGSSINIQSFTYDDVGNQITAGTTRNYVWNAANELITYYNQAGSSDPTIFAQYNYSGGNRVSKMVRTGSAGSPIYERVIYIDGVFEYHILENGTTYEKNYVHIMDDKSRIAMVRIGDQFPDDITNAVTYNLEDQIGSSTVRLNTSGGVIDKEEYYPFGDSSLRTFSKKRYRYVGKEKDLESGLYYYGARYYAAWTCRFISIDPLAADYAHLTPYNNAGNKVINAIDIDGMQSSEEQVSANSTETNDFDPDVKAEYDSKINNILEKYNGAENIEITSEIATQNGETRYQINIFNKNTGSIENIDNFSTNTLKLPETKAPNTTTKKSSYNDGAIGFDFNSSKKDVQKIQEENKNRIPEFNFEDKLTVKITIFTVGVAANETSQANFKYKGTHKNPIGNVKQFGTLGKSVVKFNTWFTVADKTVQMSNHLLDGEYQEAAHDGTAATGYVISGIMMASPTGVTQIAGATLFLGVLIYDYFF